MSTTAPQTMSTEATAKAIRRYLRRFFPCTKFLTEVRHSDGWIVLRWTGGPTCGQVEPLIGHFITAEYDAMFAEWRYVERIEMVHGRPVRWSAPGVICSRTA